MLEGDQGSLRILLEEYHNYLVVVGIRYLSDRQRVEDVIHDLFADLWCTDKEIEISTGVKSFLRGAVVNKCLAIIRKDRRIDLVEDHNENLSDQSPTPDQNIDLGILKDNIDEIIESLPNKCRQVFCMSRYEGKSHREISEALEISKKTIENHMTKALGTLRKELKRRELMNIVYLIINFSLLVGGNT